MTHNASDSVRYDEAGMVKPKNARSAGTGSVHDPRSNKYPSTIEFCSPPNEVHSNVEHCVKARRPGGEYRAGHGFKTISCSCNNHPCTCGTEKAHESIIHDNVNM